LITKSGMEVQTDTKQNKTNMIRLLVDLLGRGDLDGDVTAARGDNTAWYVVLGEVLAESGVFEKE
jgi:hypothetical protein